MSVADHLTVVNKKGIPHVAYTVPKTGKQQYTLHTSTCRATKQILNVPYVQISLLVYLHGLWPTVGVTKFLSPNYASCSSTNLRLLPQKTTSFRGHESVVENFPQEATETTENTADNTIKSPSFEPLPHRFCGPSANKHEKIWGENDMNSVGMSFPSQNPRCQFFKGALNDIKHSTGVWRVTTLSRPWR